MAFRISDTFTESLTRLSGDDQKQVKLTVFDLQMDPEAPGLKLHRLTHAKDKRFWSARVNDGLRIIIHKYPGTTLLCYVGQHDDAYAWAEKRKLDAHPETGDLTFVEVQQRVHEVAVPVYVEVAQPQPLLFSGVSDEELRKVGVPAQWLTVVKAATESSLFSVCERLPTRVAESLLDLATGTPYEAPVGSTESPARLYTESLAGSFQVRARRCLSLAVGFLDPSSTVDAYPWIDLTAERLRALQYEVARHYSPSTANRIVTTIGCVLGAALARGIVSLASVTAIQGVPMLATPPQEVRKSREVLPPDVTGDFMAGIPEIVLDPPLDAHEERLVQWLKGQRKTTCKVREAQRHFGNRCSSDYIFAIFNRLSRRNVVRRSVETAKAFETWQIHPKLYDLLG